jgi:integrase
LTKVRPRTFRDAQGKQRETPELHVRIKLRRRESWFNLGESNRQAASVKAKRIYEDLLSKGWDAVLLEQKGAQRPISSTVTLGEYIKALRAVVPIKPLTLEGYFIKLRTVVAEVASIPKAESENEEGIRDRKWAARWRAKVEAVKLCTLTNDAVQKWMRSRLAEAEAEGPAARRRAETTLNAILRGAAGLFRPSFVKMSGLQLPQPLPFTQVERPPQRRNRFRSPVDTGELMRKAQLDLSGVGPVVDLQRREAWFVFILALGAGLRRGEIDSLRWDRVDLEKGEIWVEVTDDGGAKTNSSESSIPISTELTALLRDKKASARGRFVIDGADEMPANIRVRRYRCEPVFVLLSDWLRTSGLGRDKVTSPIHTLRKLFGSEIARSAGIFAASRMLRHADIKLTRDVYADADQVKQPLNLGQWFGERVAK